MIHVDGPFFKDEFGRTLLLRGVNLGGSSKVPYEPDGATHIRGGFFDHRTVSFVGRPFPLEEADEHFARLRAWGLTFLRLLVTWEAVEHAGPGIYDEDFLDYLEQVVRKAGEHGLQLFIDPHQDVWSRMCGGDGAPGWTLEAAGMDVTHFASTGAAVVHAIHGDPFPRMIWPTNYGKLAAATMFTLFFGGNDFAPKTLIEGEPAQEYLQRHYIDAMKRVASRLKGLSQVIGFDTLNEPSPGLIGCADLDRPSGLLLGPSPTPLQCMQLGEGIPQEVAVYDLRLTGMSVRERRVLNANGVRAWLPGHVGVWRENGVWEKRRGGDARLLRAAHFSRVGEREVDFARDYLKPFLVRYAEAIRSVDSDAIIFLEGAPGGAHPGWGEQDPSQVVNAAHWYDGLTLLTKNYRSYVTVDFHTRRPVVLPWRVRRSFVRQLAQIGARARDEMGGIPTLIGEVGIPFDMGAKKAYHSGDFALQARAMDASLNALDTELLSFTLWNYTADNDNRRGDQWNDEDLSIFSRDQQVDRQDINSGGRALEAVVRPYARATAGVPLHMRFDRKRRVFDYRFRHDPSVEAPTEVYVPNYQYRSGCVVEVSDGTYHLDEDRQLLEYVHASDREVHRIRLEPCG